MKDLNEIKREIEGQITEYAARIETWKKAKVNKKKDGIDFQNISRGCEGCKTGSYYPIEDSTHPYLTINYFYGRYGEDHLAIHGYVDELPDGDERKKGYIKQFVRQTYLFTADEANKAIAEYIEKLEQCKTKAEEQLQRAEKAYKYFMTAYSEFKQQLKIECGCEKTSTNSLYYALMENADKY